MSREHVPQHKRSRGELGYYARSPQELAAGLVNNYDPVAPSELITVNCAWYGKQTNWGEHEFILLQIEDKRAKMLHGRGLVNYVVLDRNTMEEGGKFARVLLRLQAFILGRKALDVFRVSYDGDVERLLDDCQLHPHRFIEELQFPIDSPLLLYELVTLAEVVSARHPQYRATNWSCYLFAGLIWDSLCYLRPAAARNNHMGKERGRYGWFRYNPLRSDIQDTCQIVSKKIKLAQSRIEGIKLVNAFE